MQLRNIIQGIKILKLSQTKDVYILKFEESQFIRVFSMSTYLALDRVQDPVLTGHTQNPLIL